MSISVEFYSPLPLEKSFSFILSSYAPMRKMPTGSGPIGMKEEGIWKVKKERFCLCGSATSKGFAVCTLYTALLLMLVR